MKTYDLEEASQVGQHLRGKNIKAQIKDLDIHAIDMGLSAKFCSKLLVRSSSHFQIVIADPTFVVCCQRMGNRRKVLDLDYRSVSRQSLTSLAENKPLVH